MVWMIHLMIDFCLGFPRLFCNVFDMIFIHTGDCVTDSNRRFRVSYCYCPKRASTVQQEVMSVSYFVLNFWLHKNVVVYKSQWHLKGQFTPNFFLILSFTHSKVVPTSMNILLLLKRIFQQYLLLKSRYFEGCQ